LVGVIGALAAYVGVTESQLMVLEEVSP